MGWLTLAAVQPPVYMPPSTEANERMVRRGLDLLAKCLQYGADFVCLPEFFNVFCLPNDEMTRAAGEAEKLLQHVQKMLTGQKAYVILPLLVPWSGGFVDRAYLLRGGEILGYYDKVHPTLGEKEKLGILPGEEIRVFETSLARIAIAICYDIYFPEFFATLCAAEPEIIFFPALQRSEHELANESLLKARAMDTQAYWVRASYGQDVDSPWSPGMMFGQSCIVHPDGTFLANAGHYEGLALSYVPVPFVWRRQRCGGYPAVPVRRFISEDRRPRIYKKGVSLVRVGHLR